MKKSEEEKMYQRIKARLKREKEEEEKKANKKWNKSQDYLEDAPRGNYPSRERDVFSGNDNSEDNRYGS